MEASMVTIKLPARLYTQLQMLATDEQTDPIEMLTRLITLAIQERARLQSPTRAFQRILDRATDLGVTDLAEQHDHYLYGVEKR
jgi:hypothetical protein